MNSGLASKAGPRWQALGLGRAADRRWLGSLASRRALIVRRFLANQTIQADIGGRACGLCDACRLRAEGFAAAGLADPTRYAPRA